MVARKFYGTKVRIFQKLQKLEVNLSTSFLSFPLPLQFDRPLHRVHTERQWPLSGVHSIMRVKSAQPGGGGGWKPFPFHSIYHHEESCDVCSSWEGRYTHPSPHFTSSPKCTLWFPPSPSPPPFSHLSSVSTSPFPSCPSHLLKSPTCMNSGIVNGVPNPGH